MKRTVCLILSAALVLSLWGCAKAPAPEQKAPETVPETAAATTQPPTEPTLSPEELFLMSLPDKLRQACEEGIAEPQLLEDPDRPCTVEEAARLLQNAFREKLGNESRMLSMAAQRRMDLPR